MIDVKLTPVEVMLASYAGTLRRVEAMKKNRENSHGVKRNLWETDILGCLGEMAVAKHFGLYWGGNFGTFKATDLPGIQVRATDRSSGKLIVRRDDCDEHSYVLTVVKGSCCKLVGWLNGKEAKNNDWLTDFGDEEREKCFGVLQSALKPIETLPVSW